MSRRLTVLAATVLVFLGVAGLFLLAGGSWGRGGDGGGSLFGPKVAVVELEGLIAETDDLVRELRVPLHASGVAQAHGHGHPDELVRLPVRCLQRVDLRQPRVLRGVQLREHLVQRFLERKVPVLLVLVHGA